MFNGAKKAQKVKDAKIEFSVIAAPKYRVEVMPPTGNERRGVRKSEPKCC